MTISHAAPNAELVALLSAERVENLPSELVCPVIHKLEFSGSFKRAIFSGPIDLLGEGGDSLRR